LFLCFVVFVVFVFCVLLFIVLFLFCVFVVCFCFRQAITTASHQLPYRVIQLPQRVIQLPQRVMTRCGNYRSESSSVQRSLPAGASHTGGCFTPVCCDLACGPRVGAQRCLPHRRPFRTIFVIFCVLRGWVPSGASHTAGGFATCAMTCAVVRGWVASGTSHTSGGVCTAWLACARVTCRVGLLVCMCACGCMCVCRYAGVRSDATSVGSCQKAIIKQFQEHN